MAENSLGKSVLGEALTEFVGVAAFAIAWALYWQLRDPSSKLRIALAGLQDGLREAESKFQKYRENESRAQREIASLESLLENGG